MALSQDGRFLWVKTPLGKDKMVLTALTAEQRISQTFSYQLEMVSDDTEVDATTMVGEPCGFKIPWGEDKHAEFHGVVWQFAAGDIADAADSAPVRRYRAELVPWLKLLSLNRNSRIFQDKKVPEILEQVFKDSSHTDYELKLKGTYGKLEFCVQWQESDYDFATRLMNEAGIFYYFTQAADQHTLVLADTATGYFDLDQNEAGLWGDEARITAWRRSCQMVAGKFAARDYNFETPTETLDAKEKTVTKLAASKPLEVFDYPGGYGTAADGKGVVTIRMQSLERSHESVEGEGTCATFRPGGKFTLAEHPVKDECGKSYALVAVTHRAQEPYLVFDDGDSDANAYENQFECVPAEVPYTPTVESRRPQIVGPQPAVVVGPKGNEIYTDKYGRIKVQFPWDREGKADEKSSCWMRVSQDWAGKNWGSFFLPRVGQEVLVDFLGGDPNRPIVTGRVYNAKQMPPFTLPDGKTRSGIRTRSDGKADDTKFNELRFEDQTDGEHIYFHAQKDFVRVVENVDSLEVGYETSDFGAGDEPLKVKGEAGDQLIKIKTNRTVEIMEGSDSLKIAKGDRQVEIAKGDDKLVIETGSRLIEVETDYKLEAQNSILLKVGTNSIKIDKMGIEIKAKDVKVTAQMGVKVKGGMTTDIEGGIATKVKGGAMLELKGGVMKIN